MGLLCHEAVISTLRVMEQEEKWGINISLPIFYFAMSGYCLFILKRKLKKSSFCCTLYISTRLHIVNQRGAYSGTKLPPTSDIAYDFLLSKQIIR